MRFVLAVLVGCCLGACTTTARQKTVWIDSPRKPVELKKGAKLDERRYECPVRCRQHGKLVSCQAECPPVVIDKSE